MDRNYAALRELASPAYHSRMRLFMDFTPHLGVDEVLDPYYGDAKGFEEVLDLLQAASTGLLDQLEKKPL